MARDPAFLFYPGDWLGGTMTFSRSHKGAYMDLLMCQFNQGHMALQDIIDVLGGDFEKMWESKLKNKFKVDKDGLFFNEKLDTEIVKRKSYTESRRKNLSNKETHINTDMGSHMELHMENENENINENGIVLDIGISEKWNVRPSNQEMDLELNSVKGGAVVEMFKFSKNHNLTKDELTLLWSIFKAQNFTGEKFYKSKNDVFSHFINWSKTQNINGQSTSNQTKANGGNYKTAGQDVYAERLKRQLSDLNG